VPPAAQVVLLDERSDGTWLVPSAPLGRWAMRPLGKLLRAMKPGMRVTLDLSHAPVTRPRHVAAILWAEREAKRRGVELTIEAPDMISGELLAFSGLETALQVAPPPAPVPAERSAPA
jgi:hypothetical protein